VKFVIWKQRIPKWSVTAKESPFKMHAWQCSLGVLLLLCSLNLAVGDKCSYYGGIFHGRKTANGETYDKNALTAAHKTLPFGTRLRVTNTENGKSVVVRINDRGPYVAGRSLDLSEGAFKQIAPLSKGVLNCSFRNAWTSMMWRGFEESSREHFENKIVKKLNFSFRFPCWNYLSENKFVLEAVILLLYMNLYFTQV